MLVLMGFGCGGVSLYCRQPLGCWCPISAFGSSLMVLCMFAQGVRLVAVWYGWRNRA